MAGGDFVHSKLSQEVTHTIGDDCETKVGAELGGVHMPS